MRGAIVVCAALWSTGAAAASTVLLPSPTQSLGPQPPLRTTGPVTPAQLPRPPRVDTTQQVLVDVTDSGDVAAVRVRQRLTLRGLGDYFFQIPAPARDARALPGSQSEPGLRRTAIVWQGFSPGRRVLAAEVDLEPGASASVLPLRVERSANGFTLRNATSVEATGFVGNVRRSSVLPILARFARRQPTEAPLVRVDGPTTRRNLRVDAPLRIRGTLEQGGRVLRRIRLVLGGPRSAQATIPAPPGAHVTITAVPVPFVGDLVRPPRGASGEELLLRAERTLLRLARVNQYRTFLASPGTGTADAVYRYQTVAEKPPAAPADDSGNNLILILVLATGGVLALGGAVVAWAHL